MLIYIKFSEQLGKTQTNSQYLFSMQTAKSHNLLYLTMILKLVDQNSQTDQDSEVGWSVKSVVVYIPDYNSHWNASWTAYSTLYQTNGSIMMKNDVFLVFYLG